MTKHVVNSPAALHPATVRCFAAGFFRLSLVLESRDARFDHGVWGTLAPFTCRKRRSQGPGGPRPPWYRRLDIMSEVSMSIPHGRLKIRRELRALDRQHVRPRLRLRGWVSSGARLHCTNLGQPHKALGRWHITGSYGTANYPGPQPCNFGCRMWSRLTAALCSAE